MAYWAIVFLVVTLPIGILVTWSDLKRLKIPNILPIALFAIFVVVAPFVLPMNEYLFSLLYGFIALLLGVAIHALGIMPGGDLKYIAAIVPFVNTGDLMIFFMFVALSSLTAVLTHILFGRLEAPFSVWLCPYRRVDHLSRGSDYSLGLVTR